MSSQIDLLDEIFDAVDALEAGGSAPNSPATNPDGAANSCDEDDDFELLDSHPPTGGKKIGAASNTGLSVFKASVTSSSRILSSGLSGGRDRAPLLPASTNRNPTTVLTAGIGRGGRVVNSTQQTENGSSASAHFFIVQYRKPQQKKHKTWDGDAYIQIEGSRITMVSEEGKHMGSTSLVGGLPGEGSELRIGNWDCEVDRPVPFDEFKRNTSCLNNPSNAPVQYSSNVTHTPVATSTRGPARPLVSSRTPLSAAKPFKAPSVVPRPAAISTPTSRPALELESNSTTIKAVSAASFYSNTKPMKKIVIGEKSSKEREAWGGAMYDPNAPRALVMPRPPESEVKRKAICVNDVVVDPSISAKMRDHQRKGVEFMYRSVMGMNGANGQGCILADEMGLGKTLQTIALIHTLCKQSPWQNESSVIGRALVVCPVTLVSNWKKEFRKWAPNGLGVIAIEEANEGQIAAFTHHTGLNVLIIGYERLRKVIKKLASCQPPIGLIVCDEGHRLKSKDNKTTKMFQALSTARRIILTGTPVQNDLGEYWSMADFCNPGVFGTYSQFNRQFEKPITKSREPKCSPADFERGKECMETLYALTKEFVLRRTSDVLDKYLPKKSEYVVFVAPTTLQLDIFSQILGGGKGAALLRGMNSAQLATIDLLRKVANSPLLLRKNDEEYLDEEIGSVVKEATSLLRASGHTTDVNLSGKMMVLDRMLQSLAAAQTEKIVVVSNWTSTLDLVEKLCMKRRYNYLRLDGSTPQKQRQALVDQFNSRSLRNSMVFLLSAKAGGVGLNLIGASRLVLFDSDWNPSTDLQAMARIHRDGQKKPVFIYRLLTTNTIDEKIYQRQITKTGLSDQMLGGGTNKGKDSKDSFSFEELRDIFSVNLHTNGCQTHDLLSCLCHGMNKPCGDSEPSTRQPSREGSMELMASSDDDELNKGFQTASQYDPKPTATMLRKAEAEQQAKLASLKRWHHLDAFNSESIRRVGDDLLYAIAREDSKAFGKLDGKATTSTTATITTMSPSSRSRTASEEPAAKKRKWDLMDIINNNVKDILGESVIDGGTDAGVELEVETDSDDEVTCDPTSRKRKGKGKAVVKTSIPLDTAYDDTVHNLRTLAERGMGGRIMFVFEKISEGSFMQTA